MTLKLAEKELNKVWDAWQEEIDKHRKHTNFSSVVKSIPDETREKIKEYTMLARTPTDKGVVSFLTLTELINDEFGYKIGRATLQEWYRKWTKE